MSKKQRLIAIASQYYKISFFILQKLLFCGTIDITKE